MGLNQQDQAQTHEQTRSLNFQDILSLQKHLASIQQKPSAAQEQHNIESFKSDSTNNNESIRQIIK